MQDQEVDLIEETIEKFRDSQVNMEKGTDKGNGEVKEGHNENKENSIEP